MLESAATYLKDLLEGCLRHDRASQQSLYKEFYSYGMSICLRYADSRDEAAETLNDGFMKIFSALNKYDFDKPFQPWLRKILVNLSINRYHKRQRQVETEEITELNHEADDERVVVDGKHAAVARRGALGREGEELVREGEHPRRLEHLRQAGEIAQAAGVKTLVLNHFVPGDDSVPDDVWRESAAKAFRGEIVVGRDLLEI